VKDGKRAIGKNWEWKRTSGMVEEGKANKEADIRRWKKEKTEDKEEGGG